MGNGGSFPPPPPCSPPVMLLSSAVRSLPSRPTASQLTASAIDLGVRPSLAMALLQNHLAGGAARSTTATSIMIRLLWDLIDAGIVNIEDTLFSENYDDETEPDLSDYGNHRMLVTKIEMPSGKIASIATPIYSTSPCMCLNIGDNLELIELLPETTGQREYNLLRREMHKTLGRHNITQYRFRSVHKVVNCCLWERYRSYRKKIADEVTSYNERLLFHGTPAADSIVRTGFDVSRANPSGMFGAGIYFAEHSSKSNQYAAAFLGHKCMLICRVVLGQQKILETADKSITAESLQRMSCHSVRGRPSASGLRYPEHIVYSNYQAYPEYLVKYDC